MSHHTSSCTPCKRKKCKCDRKLPSCTQCTIPGLCTYSLNNKRGIPKAYLPLLTARLSATEDALYNTLLLLHHLQSQTSQPLLRPPQQWISVAGRACNENKESRMGEWSLLPLDDRDEVEKWFEAVGKEIRGVEGTSTGVDLRQDSTEVEGEVRGESSVVAHMRNGSESTMDGVESITARFDMSPVMVNKRRGETGTQVPSRNPVASRGAVLPKSQELSRARQDMYY